jgi:hypothetical protein
MRLILVVVAAAFAIVAAVVVDRRSSALRPVAAEPLLAVTDGGRLVRLDPLALRPLPGRGTRIGAPAEGWARAPEGSRLAIATDRGSQVRFFDAERLRPTIALATSAHGAVAAVAWPRRDRLWLTLASPGCCATGTTTVLAIDPIRRRVVVRRDFDAGLVGVAGTPDGVVLLLAPSGTIGFATLATVDAAGRAGSVPLEVSAGVMPTEGVPLILRTRRPALAVDPRGGRAYVLSSRPEVAEVELRGLAVRYHRLSPERSLFERLLERLEPPARAQRAVGPVRFAHWVQPGRIAVSGWDAHARWRPRGALEQVSHPAGLQLIDTRHWQTRELDEDAAGFRASDGLILTDGDGLAGYRAADGDEAFHVLEDRRVTLVATPGSLAYVRDGAVHHVVDLAAGRVVATSRARWPRHVLEPAPGPWRTTG